MVLCNLKLNPVVKITVNGAASIGNSIDFIKKIKFKQYHWGYKYGMRSRLIQLAPEEVGISGIVAAELWFGVANSQKKKQNTAALVDFLNYATLLDWPSSASVQ